MLVFYLRCKQTAMYRIPTILILATIFTHCQPPAGQEQPQVGCDPFCHGVASGDPLYDKVVLWTRVAPKPGVDSISVAWEIAETSAFEPVVAAGRYTTDQSRDFTVKVDVGGLRPGRQYFYRFHSGGIYSPIGKTKTASPNADSLKLAVVSCANYEWGYFTAYRRIAEKELDAVVHLGDYIYEYAPGGYGDTTIGRKHEPPTELISLADYRMRYAQYRSDPDLQAMHASHPFIAVWDDHEIANDVYVSGAQNHQPDEGSFEARKMAAVKSYYEWMPVREGATLYRSFEFGDLASLIMLDERLEGRTAPAESMDDPDFASGERSMLGTGQLEWLQGQLRDSQATWKLIGNQVIFSDIDQSAVFPGNPRNLDSWSGYPAEKNEIARFIKGQGLSNVIFITGDTHASWAMEVMAREVSRAPLAIEFGAPSISSANYDEYTTRDSAELATNLYQNYNPHIQYANLMEHGYFILTLESERAIARYYYMEDIRQPDAPERMAKMLWVNEGAPVIKEQNLYGF